MSLIVQKYGGTSVESLAHMGRVAQHIQNTVHSGHQVIVTISAMGQQTDQLLAMAHDLSSHPPRRELDMLLTTGERQSAALLAIALDKIGVPSLSLTGSQCGILTDEIHGNARITQILGGRIREGLAARKVVIVAGFQGVSAATKEITTLGRGGSDLSAIAIAAAMKAEVCQLYKDVRGIYTIDPRLVPTPRAKLIPRVSVEAMLALTWGGSGVVHTRGLHLAAKFRIPVEVRSSLELDQIGTFIGLSTNHQGEIKTMGPSKNPVDAKQAFMEDAEVIAITDKKPLTLLIILSQGAEIAESPQVGSPKAGSNRDLWNNIHQWLWREGEAPLAAQGGVGRTGGGMEIQIVLNTKLVDALVQAPWFQENAKVLNRRDGLYGITVVGQGFKQSPELVEKIYGVLPSIPQYFAVNHDGVTLVVSQAEGEALMVALHRELLE